MDLSTGMSGPAPAVENGTYGKEGISPQKPYSGTFNVRIPSELHQEISMKAETDGVSMNAWITDAFESKLRLENANS